MTVEYRIGDCVEVMREFPENHFDACVTDPPYGLEFMGKEWDKLQTAQWRGLKEDWQDNHPENHIANRLSRGPRYGYDGIAMQEWHHIWAIELLRVLKPGAHALVFGGTRTHHRLMCALEDAGFEIRDCLMFLYGSGFPKSLDVSKAIDKAAGADRETINVIKRGGVSPSDTGRYNWHTNEGLMPKTDIIITAPATEAAKKWSGWGTALKPAYEPIVLARKPLIGTVAANILKYGTGGLNIDASRIELQNGETPSGSGNMTGRGTIYNAGWNAPSKRETPTLGRWPANVIFDEEAAKLLDAQSGERQAGAFPKTRNADGGGLYEGGWKATDAPGRIDLDAGGASRFFYTAKASREEREAGLEKKNAEPYPVEHFSSHRLDDLRMEEQQTRNPVRNRHPTVKPLSLMRYLIKLITPPNGLVIDPFLGSGTTLLACRLENVNGFGIEKEKEYEAIIKGRLSSIPPSLEAFNKSI